MYEVVQAALDYASDFSISLKHHKHYMNTASLGLAPDKSIIEAEQALRFQASNPDKASDLMWNEVEKIRSNIFHMYGFNARQVGVGESTSHCIYKMVAATKPSRVAVTSEEFPGVVLMVKSYCKSRSCDVRVYDGVIEDAVKEAVDDGVDVVLVSAVTWVTGYRPDLAEITSYAHKRGVKVIVDAVQHFGVLSLREGENGADGYAASPKKWLLAPHSNTAVCIVGEGLMELVPPYYGLANSEIGDWSNYWSDPGKNCDDDLPLRSDGQRFGAPTGQLYHSMVAARSSIEYLNNIGIGEIEKHVFKLHSLLVEQLENTEVEVLSEGFKQKNKSSIVSISLGDYNRNRRLYEHLLDHGVVVSLRGQKGYSVVRISLHIYNTEKDVLSLTKTIKEYLND